MQCEETAPNRRRASFRSQPNAIKLPQAPEPSSDAVCTGRPTATHGVAVRFRNARIVLGRKTVRDACIVIDVSEGGINSGPHARLRSQRRRCSRLSLETTVGILGLENTPSRRHLTSLLISAEGISLPWVSMFARQPVVQGFRRTEDFSLDVLPLNHLRGQH